jgi:hypothetical protein
MPAAKKDHDRPEVVTTGRWRRSTKALSSWARENREVIRVAAERGPLTAVGLVFQGDLGGPLTRMVLRMVPPYDRVRYAFTVLLLPAITALAVLSLTNSSLGAKIAWRLILIAVLVLLALVAVLLTYAIALRRTRHTILGPVRRWGAADLWYFGWLLILLPTLAFAAASALSIRAHLLPIDGVSPTDRHLAYATFETYLWNLAGAIPLLDIPATLHWKPQLTFPTIAGGATVLFYKLLLIVPLAQLLAIAVTRLFGEDSGAGPAALTHGASEGISPVSQPL